MPPERRHVAKKSAPSHYMSTPPRSTQKNSSPSVVSPAMSTDDQLKYIDKWGVNQFEACRECIESGLGTHCFIASRVSTRCGNCLRKGKQCHFSQTIDSDDDPEDEDDEQDEVIDVEVLSQGETERDGHVTTQQIGNDNIIRPIVAENLLNYDPEDDEPQIISPTSSPLFVSTNRRVPRPHSSPNKRQFAPTGIHPTRKHGPKAASSRTANRLATTPTTSPLTMRSSTPPLATRSATPPLAMDEPSFDHPYAPTSSYEEPLIAGPADLSFAEKNSIIVAMQRHMDWNAVAAESGVDVDRGMRWWMRVSSELVRR